MNYIKAAVELADGFEYKGNETTMAGSVRPFVETPIGFLSVSWDAFIKTPAYLDALAAQLVRQVDELPAQYYYHVEALRDETTVYESHGSCDSNKGMAFGPDRTMNTIKAIVDSGVLVATEQEGET